MRGSDVALVQFSFVSRLADGLPEAALLRLERQSAAFNRQHGLTGEMCLHGSSVHQVIEGSWSVVMPLAGHIVTDRRHEAISITSFRTIEARNFDTWSAIGFGSPFPCDALSKDRVANLLVLPLEVVDASPPRAARVQVP
jgi:hypothetical protein